MFGANGIFPKQGLQDVALVLGVEVVDRLGLGFAQGVPKNTNKDSQYDHAVNGNFISNANTALEDKIDVVSTCSDSGIATALLTDNCKELSGHSRRLVITVTTGGEGIDAKVQGINNGPSFKDNTIGYDPNHEID